MRFEIPTVYTTPSYNELCDIIRMIPRNPAENNSILVVFVFLQPNPTTVMSKKQKTPWITYNDDDVADSHFCIEYLNKNFSMFFRLEHLANM